MARPRKKLLRCIKEQARSSREADLFVTLLAHRPLSARPLDMDAEAEQRALAGVRTRLQQRFPDLDDAVVEAAVRVAHSELTGRVRDFVPVLVEHVARDRLASTHRGGPLQTEGRGRENAGARGPG